MLIPFHVAVKTFTFIYLIVICISECILEQVIMLRGTENEGIIYFGSNDLYS